MGMPTSGNDEERLNLNNPMDRRRFVELVGIGGVTTLAGCSGSPGTTTEEGGSGGGSTDTEMADDTTETSGSSSSGGGRKVLSFVGGGSIPGKLYGSTNLLNETITATSLLYNSLVTRNPETGAIEPDAVKSLPEISEDGTKFTFDVREDITFADGSNLTAQDIKYSFDIIEEYDLVHKETFSSRFENIEVEDDYRFTVTTKNPYAPWVEYTEQYFSIVREGIAEEVEKFPDDLNTGPKKGCNSGPFNLAEYKPQEIARFTARDDYHEDGIPRVDEIRWNVIKESSSQQVAIRKNNVQILGDPQPKDFDPLQQRDGINGGSKPNQSSRIKVYLSGKPPFDDVNARKAFAYAVDRKSIIENILFGHGFVSSIPAPPESWFYNPEADIYGARPKPDKVKEHLEKAGMADGFSFECQVSSQPPIPDTAALIQQQLAKVGIDMEINKVDPGSFYGPIANREYVAGLEFWNSVPNPDYYFSTLWTNFGKYNKWHRWGNAVSKDRRDEVTEMVKESRRYVSREKRKPIYQKILKILAEESPYIWIGGADVINLWRQNVKNYHVNPAVYVHLRNVGIK